MISSMIREKSAGNTGKKGWKNYMNQTKKGVDVSTHNGMVDWKTVEQGCVEFAIIRAGFGNTASQQDRQFSANMKGTLEAGVPVGVYWFSYARSVEEARTEAKACLEVISSYQSQIVYPVFFDFEYDSEEYAEEAGVVVNARYVTDVTKAFCETIAAAGYRAGYYTNQDYYKNKLYPTELEDYELWLADYTGGPAYECSIQQYTSTGKLEGISGNVDMNICFKEYSQKNPLAENSNTLYGTCTGTGVRIRSDAHTAAKILGSANHGDRLELLDDDGWGWSKVRTNGVTGWMYNRYVQGPKRSKIKTVYCSGTKVNLRETASLQGKVLKQLNPGDVMEMVCILPNGWLDTGDGYLFYDKSYLSIQ